MLYKQVPVSKLCCTENHRFSRLVYSQVLDIFVTKVDTCQSRGVKGPEPKIYSLVMTGRHVKLAEEYISIAKVAVGPPLCRLIAKLFSNEKPLPNKINSRVQD